MARRGCRPRRGATCVGGQGAHWTCATPAARPAPSGSPFIDDAELGRAARRRRGAAARPPALVRRRPAGDGDPRPAPRRVRAGRHHRPVAAGGRATRERTARCGWSGTDVVLGDVTAGAHPTLHPARRRRLCARAGPRGRPRRRRRAARPARPAPRRRCAPTSSSWPPTRCAPRSCCGPRASGRRRSAATSPSTRCCSASWPSARTSCRRGRPRPARWTRSERSSRIPFDEERHPFHAS